MSHDSDVYFEEVRKALLDVYRSPKDIVRVRWADEDQFVNDQMDLIRATYEAGYLDAMDDVRSTISGLERDFDND